MSSRSQALLRVPVEKTPAMVVLASGERFSALLFLPPGYHPGELFSGTERFVPLGVQGGARLVARDAIASITVNSAFLPADGGMPHERQAVVVFLQGGGKATGELRWVPLPGRNRTLDHLNSEPAYFVLDGPEGATFIAKAHVVAVEEVAC
jgi:hypothetical protein